MNTDNDTAVADDSPQKFAFASKPEAGQASQTGSGNDNDGKPEPGGPAQHQHQQEPGSFLSGSDPSHAKPADDAQSPDPGATSHSEPLHPAANPRPAARHRRPVVPEAASLSPLTAILLASVLTVACIAIWMVRDLGKQVDALENRLASQEPVLQTSDSTKLGIESLLDDIARLKQRNDEHDQNREQLRQAMNESQQQLLEEFIIRIVALEQGGTGHIQPQHPLVDETPRRTENSEPATPAPIIADLDMAPADEPSAAVPAHSPALPEPSPPQPTPSVEPEPDVRIAQTPPAAIPAPSAPRPEPPPPQPTPSVGLKPDVQTARTSHAKQAPSSAPWVVNLLSASTRTEAERKVGQLAAKGIDAEIHPAVVKDQTWYRIRVVGFATVGDARQFGRKVAKDLGLKGAWVARR